MDRRGRPPWVPQQCCQPFGDTPHAGDPRPYGGWPAGAQWERGRATRTVARRHRCIRFKPEVGRFAPPDAVAAASAPDARILDHTARLPVLRIVARSTLATRAGLSGPPKPCRHQNAAPRAYARAAQTKFKRLFFSPLLRQYGRTHATAATGQCGAGGVEYVNPQHNHSSLQQTAPVVDRVSATMRGALLPRAGTGPTVRGPRSLIPDAANRPRSSGHTGAGGPDSTRATCAAGVEQ